MKNALFCCAQFFLHRLYKNSEFVVPIHRWFEPMVISRYPGKWVVEIAREQVHMQVRNGVAMHFVIDFHGPGDYEVVKVYPLGSTFNEVEPRFVQEFASDIAPAWLPLDPALPVRLWGGLGQQFGQLCLIA